MKKINQNKLIFIPLLILGLLNSCIVFAAGNQYSNTSVEKIKNNLSSQGILVEHTQDLNTLAMSFLEFNEPMVSVRNQIVSEFLKESKNPKFIFVVYDKNQITEISEFIKNLKPDFDLKNIQFIETANSFEISTWIRDISPIMIKDAKNKLKVFQFNYTDTPSSYSEDQTAIAKKLKLKPELIELRLEGGNVLSDDQGRLYVSVAAIENNMKTDSKDEYESIQKKFEEVFISKMNATEVVWLPRVVKELEGTGHVDMYLRFLKNNQVIVASSKDPRIKETLNQIAKILTDKGFQVHRLQANNKIVNNYRELNIFPSYTNSIIVGQTIFIPKFNVVEDASAVVLYTKLGYKVVQISGDSIAFGGSIHCLTYLYP